MKMGDHTTLHTVSKNRTATINMTSRQFWSSSIGCQSGSMCTSNWLSLCLELCMAQQHHIWQGLSTRRLHRLPPTAIADRQHVPRRPKKYVSLRSFIRRRWSETSEQLANLSSPAWSKLSSILTSTQDAFVSQARRLVTICLSVPLYKYLYLLIRRNLAIANRSHSPSYHGPSGQIWSLTSHTHHHISPSGQIW